MISFQKRGLVEVVLLCLFTFGIYQLYWNVVTKRELNKAGAQIPNAFLMIIPLVHFYYLGPLQKLKNSLEFLIQRINHL